MNLSVVIPSYNGAHRIVNILTALEKQSVKGFEVVFVIDGSTDNSRQVLRDNNFDIDLKVVHQENKGRAATRNVGAKAANHELIVYMDDDMRPGPSCIETHFKHHQKWDGTILVGAQITDINLLTSDIQLYRHHLDVIWSKPMIEHEGPLTKEMMYVTGANFSIQKNTLEMINGFDERLTIAEDYDLAGRAFNKGIKVYYNHDAFANHDDFITCLSFISKQREYFQDHIKLMKMNPDIYIKFPIQDESLSVLSFRKFMYSFLGRRFFANMIDRFNIFRFILPKSIRYKIYQTVIWGLVKFHPNRNI